MLILRVTPRKDGTPYVYKVLAGLIAVILVLIPLGARKAIRGYSSRYLRDLTTSVVAGSAGRLKRTYRLGRTLVASSSYGRSLGRAADKEGLSTIFRGAIEVIAEEVP